MDKFCNNCGRQFAENDRFCLECGTARAMRSVPEPTQTIPTEDIDATAVRAPAPRAPEAPGPQWGEPSGPVAPPVPTAVIGVPPAGPAYTAVLPVTPPPPPSGPAYVPGPASGSPAPGLLIATCITMFGLAILMMYPFLRWGFPLIKDTFSGGWLGLAFGMLVLYVLLVLVLLGVALITLGVGMLRGNRVSHGVSIVLLSAIAVGELIGLADTSSAPQPGWVTALIVAIAAVLITALTAPPGVRRFFAERADAPLSVGMTQSLCVYLGWVVAANGLLLMLIGALGTRFVVWGAAFFVVAALLILSDILLAGGRIGGPVLATVGLVAAVALVFAFPAANHVPIGTSAVVPATLGIVGLVACWWPATVAYVRGPGPRVRRSALAGALALSLLGVLGIGGAATGSYAASRGTDSLDGYTPDPGYDYSSSPSPSWSDSYDSSPYSYTPEPDPSSSPSYDDYAPPATMNNQWTVTATADGGYTELITFSSGVPEHYTSGMQNGRATAGGACSIDENTDAVIPAKLTLTNTTSGFPTAMAIHLSPDYDWDSPAFDVHFNDGDDCKDGSWGVQCESTEPHSSCTTYMFIVVQNYYSPDHPNGDLSLLDTARLSFSSGTYSGDSDDITFSPGSVSGPNTDNGSFPVAG